MDWAIGCNHQVDVEQVSMGGNEGREIWATNFLLAFEQNNYLTWQLPVTGEQCLKCQQLRQVLPFVIADATAIQTAMPNGGLKWRREPGIQRIGRLDIVVAVEQYSRCVGHGGTAAQHHRPAGRGDEL